MIKIMMSAGEVSGDMHGAALASEIKKINRNAYIFGMGGERMKSAGVDVKVDISAKGTVGIVEVLKFLPHILIAYFRMKSILNKERPDLIVLIDYQGFNMLLAAYAKKIGIRTVYYIPPQEWLWGTPKGVKSVADTIDRIVSIFEDEARIYKEAGGNVTYVGNPNIDLARPIHQRAEFCRMIGLNASFPIFGLFPGSRKQEIDSLLPEMLKAAKQIKASVPNAQFVLSLSSLNFKRQVDSILKTSGQDIKIAYKLNYDILAAANVSIAASGTVIMEAAILDSPIIMVYKLSPVTYHFSKKFLKIKLKYYCMPNILADREVAPEMIQEQASAKNMAFKTLEIFSNRSKMEEIKNGYSLIRSKLGGPGAIKRAADAVMSELKGKI